VKDWLKLIKHIFYKVLDESSVPVLHNKEDGIEGETTMKYQPSYLEMVSYKRPQGSKAQSKFCNRFLRPIFGAPDIYGNYTHIVMNGDKLPNVAFMSHHDTVHKQGGRQTVSVVNETAFVMADCLGADCTTGVYIMLRMIDAQVPGVYVVHAAEEIGCVGSKALVKSNPEWISHVDVAISFDRKGYESIITYQMGMRCCSDAFADSLSAILCSNFEKDTTGVYTDSNEYVDVIAECTNLSVGYFAQHTSRESQDIAFMECLITDLINADWSKLVVKRKAGELEYDDTWYKPATTIGSKSKEDPDLWEEDYGVSRTTYGSYGDDLYAEMYGHPSDNKRSNSRIVEDENTLIMRDVIHKYAEEIAEILISYGYNASGLLDDAEDIAIKRNRPIGRLLGKHS
jgi:hypothetical protein